jgi:hypothetical protein
MAKPKHSIARLREVFDYKPRKGYFVWKIKKHGYAGMIYPGDVAGSKPTGRPDDRIGIGFEGFQYRAHILAYAFMNNKWPPKGKLVDHHDGNGANNKWTNLREVTRTQNRWNTTRIRKDNCSGKAGVSWNSFNQKWLSQIVVHGKCHENKLFTDKSKAIAHRLMLEKKYFGEYAPQ